MRDTLKEARMEHETLLRNPAYCLYLQMDELAMQQEPSLNQDIPEEKPIQEAEFTPMRIYLNIDRKSLELQKRIALLESQVSSLREKGGGEGYVIK